MTSFAEMEMIAAEALIALRGMTEGLSARLGRDPTLREVAQGLAIAYGAARGAVRVNGSVADAAALSEFVQVAADDASFCLRGLREAGV